MTIGKRLYFGFGMILGLLTLLFFVNLIAASRQSSALESFGAIEAVRYQIVQNCLNLNNFLLSGDPRDADKVNKRMLDTSHTLKRGQSQADSEALRIALIQADSTDAAWGDNFPKPLLAN